jgi:osmotically-inducible protein OsmY
MTNEELEMNVSDELYWDPKLDSEAIAIAVDDGRVTLRGTVGSFYEKREAKTDAERVYGVKSVDDQLSVKIMTDAKREDAELRGEVLQAMMLDSLIPKTIDAHVDDGFVTLTGTALWQYQRDEAERVAGNIYGVSGIDDEIALKQQMPKAADVSQAIEKAFKRNAKLDAKGLTVTWSSGTVTVSGVVNSWAEHDEAIDAAWAAPGVTSVEDKISVDY